MRKVILFVLFLGLETLSGEDLPQVPTDVSVSLFASEPLVRNASAIAFDSRGRLSVGQGPQYRGPTPETEGDRVDFLLDDDGDGKADRAHTFAEGFNSIQGMAWRGSDLYVANAPDLTIVRDLDGDDVADEYVRLFTGLGSLEHGLHGLNFAPDGKLYLSKGNTKGRNTMEQLAPKAFRELWGLPSPEGAPDFPEPVITSAENYQKNYKEPQDDWGRQGGVLRCEPDGTHLEIFSRGMRNPWDIAFDDRFQWLGTDNDQTEGDKFIAPFYGAHYGWGHEWSYDWDGLNHLPTVPANGPLFEGSGAGVVWFEETSLPERFRGSFLVADWMRRVIYVYRPEWRGANFLPSGVQKLQDFELLADAGGGRAMAKSHGVLFDPTDMAIGPDGAVYVASWGREYGLVLDEKGEQQNAGRVFRIAGSDAPLSPTQKGWVDDVTRLDEGDFVRFLDSPLDARRVMAQEQLVERCSGREILELLRGDSLSVRQKTWLQWAAGRSQRDADSVNQYFAGRLAASGPLEDRLTAVRILAFRKALPESFAELLSDSDPRIRFAAAVAVREASGQRFANAVIQAASDEEERLAYFAQWNALRELIDESQRRDLLDDERPGVRLAALLGLLEDGLLGEDEVRPLIRDEDAQVSKLAEDWLEKAGFGARPLLTMTPESGTSYVGDSVMVTLETPVEGGEICFTLDGNPPVENSPRYRGPVAVREGQTLRAAVLKQRIQVGRVFVGSWKKDRTEPYQPSPFLTDISAKSGRNYQMEWAGLRPGALVYSDRNYRIRNVPDQLKGLPFLQTANEDDGSSGSDWVRFRSDEPLTVFIALDTRLPAIPNWMGVGEANGFEATNLVLGAEDPKSLAVYRKVFPAGEIHFGGNTNDGRVGGKGNYLIAFERGMLLKSPSESVTIESVLAKMDEADAARGRDLFLHAKGAGCYQCHQMEGRGNVFAPDLSDMGSRGDARTIIESILQPSATITEGFSMQVFTMENGAVFSGIVLEETGQKVKLGMMGGIAQELEVAKIAKRESPHVSAMPAGYGAAMNATQIADLAAWLMEQKKGFSFRQDEAKLDLRLDGQSIASYLLNHEKLTRRAFVNVRTPSGLPVTRNFPPRKPEDIDPGYRAEEGIIHPVLHAGLWMSFGWIDGNDYWRLQSPVRFDRFLEEPREDEDEASFATRDRYLDREGNETICFQDTRYRFRRVEEGILLEWDAEFYNDDRDFVFGDQEESGLALRIASPLRVQGGNGRIVNERGEENGSGTWGKEFDWVNYSGEIGGKRVGLLVMPHPDNARASWSHSRDYGVLVSNPFPKQPKERREPYVTTTVKKGERYRLRYTVLIHEVPAEGFDAKQLAGRLKEEIASVDVELIEDANFSEGFGAAFIYGSEYTGGRRPPLGEVMAYRDISPWQIHLIPDGAVKKIGVKTHPWDFQEGLHHDFTDSRGRHVRELHAHRLVVNHVVEVNSPEKLQFAQFNNYGLTKDDPDRDTKLVKRVTTDRKGALTVYYNSQNEIRNKAIDHSAKWARDTWPHMLVNQRFHDPIALADYETLDFGVTYQVDQMEKLSNWPNAIKGAARSGMNLKFMFFLRNQSDLEQKLFVGMMLFTSREKAWTPHLGVEQHGNVFYRESVAPDGENVPGLGDSRTVKREIKAMIAEALRQGNKKQPALSTNPDKYAIYNFSIGFEGMGHWASEATISDLRFVGVPAKCEK